MSFQQLLQIALTSSALSPSVLHVFLLHFAAEAVPACLAADSFSQHLSTPLCWRVASCETTVSLREDRRTCIAAHVSIRRPDTSVGLASSTGKAAGEQETHATPLYQLQCLTVAVCAMCQAGKVHTIPRLVGSEAVLQSHSQLMLALRSTFHDSQLILCLLRHIGSQHRACPIEARGLAAELIMLAMRWAHPLVLLLLLDLWRLRLLVFCLAIAAQLSCFFSSGDGGLLQLRLGQPAAFGQGLSAFGSRVCSCLILYPGH